MPCCKGVIVTNERRAKDSFNKHEVNPSSLIRSVRTSCEKENTIGMCVSAYPVFIYVAIFQCEEYHITRYKPY